MMKAWLLAGLAVVLLNGCTSASEPPAAADSSSPAAKKSVLETPSAKKPLTFPAAMKGDAKKGPDGSLVDKYDLPLVINIEAPEVPEEIRGPSPPIKS